MDLSSDRLLVNEYCIAHFAEVVRTTKNAVRWPETGPTRGVGMLVFGFSGFHSSVVEAYVICATRHGVTPQKNRPQ